MRRRDLLTTSLFAAATACSPGSKPSRPNILLVIADDQSWKDAGAYGAKHVRTPAFDRIAREGVLFMHSFCASPSCTPSRSAVLMGRHVWQQGEAGVLYGAIPPSIPLYTHLLEDTGYAIGYTGKGWAPGDFAGLGLKRNPCGKEYNRKRHAEVRPGIEPSDYAANFQQFLAEKPQDKPFCFWLGSKEPHRVYDEGSGLRLGKKLEDAQVPAYLPDVPAVRSDLLDYYLEIEWYDEQLGRALKVLEDTGQLDDTLIIVTSDNGMPFPRAKVNVYDAGLRMPFAVRWGDKFKRGRVVDTLISHTDIAPTFLDAAGIQAPAGMAGQSLLPLLRDEHFSRGQVFSGMERHTMCRPDGQGYPMRTIRTLQYRYIRNYTPDRWPTGGDFLSSNKTTHGDIDGAPSKDALLDKDTAAKFPTQVALCLNKRPPEELYDVTADPDQIHNVIAEARYAEPLGELRAYLQQFLEETGDPRTKGQDPWQGYIYRQTSGYGASFNRSLPESVREAARVKIHKPE